MLSKKQYNSVENNRTRVGSFVLLADAESGCGLFFIILTHLDVKSLCNVKRSSLIQQFGKKFQCNDFERIREIAIKMNYQGTMSINEILISHPAKRLYKMIQVYRKEFPNALLGSIYENNIPIPFVCACQHGRLADIKLFVEFYSFHKYITNRDANGYKDGLLLRDYVNQVGISSGGGDYTPLGVAVTSQHFDVCKYLIEQGGADPNVTDKNSWNALHQAVFWSEKSTDIVKLLMCYMSVDEINKETMPGKMTALDWLYECNNSAIRQDLADLLRLKGAKSNHYDQQGRYVGRRP